MRLLVLTEESSIYQCFMFNHTSTNHPITATCQHVPIPSPWCWTFPAVAIGRAPQRRRAAKAAQPVPPAPAWMTTTSPWTTRPKSMVRGQSPWGTTNDTNKRHSQAGHGTRQNVADSANFTTKHVGKRNLKETEKGKHLQTALSQGHKMSQNVLRCFKPSNCCSHQVTS